MTIMTGCNQSKDPLTHDEGVVINGVRWATRNVNMPGTFTESLEDAGMLFQWNRKKGWNAIDRYVEDWDTSSPTGTEWEIVNDPSPRGWRVPTIDEILSLFDREKVSWEWIRSEWLNPNENAEGIKFTDIITGAYVFFPFVDNRWYRDGRLGRNVFSEYWSSTLFCDWRSSAYSLGLSPGMQSTRGAEWRHAFSIRSVAK